jgi:Leucine-rich repeat (LRR) protein
LPESFGNLSSLEKFRIDDTKIETLPESFGNLRNLKHFEAFRKSLTSLPESFGNLASLEVIDLRESNISYFPESFARLPSLKVFHINAGKRFQEIQNENPIHLPESFGNLASLEELEMNGNIAPLPESFGNLRSLKKLSLSFTVYKFKYGKRGGSSSRKFVNNDFYSLPESFGNLTSLESFIISGSNLRILPESFGNLSALKTLHIENTKLELLPDSFGNLNNLAVLTINKKPFFCNEKEVNELHGVPIKLPAVRGQMPKLRKLTVTVDTLSDSICLPPSIEELSVDCDQFTAMPVTALPEKRDQVDKELLAFLKGLSPEAFDRLKQELISVGAYNEDGSIPIINLQELRITARNNKTLPDSICTLPWLVGLDIHCDQLTAIPENIGNLKTLEWLRISAKNLQTLPDSICELRLLESISIYCDQLTALPENIGNLKNLKYLYVHANKIKTLPDSIGNLDLLEVLYINSTRSFSETEELYLPNRAELESLPGTMSKLVSLRELELSHTKITSLPDFLAELPALEGINIAGCNVKKIPPSIQRLIDNRELVVCREESKYGEYEVSLSDVKKR